MQCPLCGHVASERRKFCPECGYDLRDVTDPVADPTELVIRTTPDEELPKLGDLPTREIRPRDEIPDPDWSVRTEDGPVVVPGPAPSASSVSSVSSVTSVTSSDPPTPAHPTPAITPATPATPATSDVLATSRLPETAAPAAENPALFDGSGDVGDYPPPREPFQLKLIFLLAFFGAIAVLLSAAGDVVDLRTSTPVSGITTGIRTLDTLGTNLAVAGFVGAIVMTIGALLACFGFRWGAGLAGGAGLALVGWAGIVVGLAELQIANAESITLQTTDVAFTLKVTRDLGFWVVVVSAAVGALVFLASLRAFGAGGRRPLNPWTAALGAVAGVIVAAGPLLPEGNATFDDNFRSTTGFDLPDVYFAARLTQLGLIVGAVVLGMLIVRAYGLGLAAGGISVAIPLWATSLAGTGRFPVGIAIGNFGSSDSTPHAVTSVGMVLAMLMLLIAAVLATITNIRRRRRY